MIKRIPFHFAGIVLVTGGLWYVIFRTALELQHSTIEAYRKKLEIIDSVAKSSSSQSSQLMFFTNDPNSEKLIPQNSNAPALAYQSNGGTMWQWDVKSQSWK